MSKTIMARRRSTTKSSASFSSNSPVDFIDIDEELKRAQQLLLYNIQQAIAGDALLSEEEDNLAAITSTGFDNNEGDGEVEEEEEEEDLYENRNGNHYNEGTPQTALASMNTSRPAGTDADVYALLGQMSSDLNAVIDSKVTAERDTKAALDNMKSALEEYNSYVGALEKHTKLLLATLRTNRSSGSDGVTYNKISELLIDKVMDNIERTILTSPNATNSANNDNSVASSNKAFYESIAERILPFEQSILEEKAISKSKTMNESIDFDYSIYDGNSETDDTEFTFVNVEASTESRMHILFNLFVQAQAEIDGPPIHMSSPSLAHSVAEQKCIAKSVFLAVVFALDLFDDDKASMKKFQYLFDMQMCDPHDGREKKFRSRMNYSDSVAVFTRVAAHSSSSDNKSTCLNILLQRLWVKIDVFSSNTNNFIKIVKNFFPLTQNTGLYTRVAAYQSDLYLAFNRSKNYGLNEYLDSAETKQNSKKHVIISRINKKFSPAKSDYATPFECFCHNHKISDCLVPSYTVKRVSQFCSKLCDDDQGLRYFITCFGYMILVIHDNSQESSTAVNGVVDDIFGRVKNTFYE